MSLTRNDHLYLIDANGFLYRAFFGMPKLTRYADDMPVGAVNGFCNMIWNILDRKAAEERPTHIAVIFDHSGITFRNDIYPEYKANRSGPPDELKPQFKFVRDATRAFGLPCIEQNGYEADDIIATYARLAAEEGARVTIFSSDKDLMQLVEDTVEMFDAVKDNGPDMPRGRYIREEQVIDKFGVSPDKVPDVLAIMGDPTDNVPGVHGIGEKGAAALIGSFGSVEAVIAAAEAGNPRIKPRQRAQIIADAEKALISKQLVTLDRSVPVETDIDELAVVPANVPALMSFLAAMEFEQLRRKVAHAYGVSS